MLKFVPTPTKNAREGFKLVHISDPHLSNLDNVSWQQLINKRILGYLSWRYSRRYIHRLDILTALIQDLDTARAHHLIISGDLTHIGTPAECMQVSAWLEKLGSATDISVVPGNHDTYVEADNSQTIDLWSDYIDSDTDANRQTDETTFPSLRQRGPVAIIGLSTAVPTAPFFATGRLGHAQIERLAQLLLHTGEQGLFRVVVLHHGPLADSNKFRKRLMDSAQFRSVIKAHGAELILHGHGHHPVKGILETANAAIPVIGAASASLLSGSEIKRAGYNIYEVNTTASGWKLQFQSRSYDEDTAAFKIREELEFDLPASVLS
jgi:3',5'-cyclic AMP phosphodiesterase CpdA